MKKHHVTNEEAAELLYKYRLTNDKQAKEILVDHYSPLVRKIAFGYARKKPNILDMGDLESAGYKGLLDAMSKFDTDKGASFKTYAVIRIRGSILDEINALDWTPRPVRKAIKELIVGIEEHHAKSGTEPTNKDLAKNIGTKLSHINTTKSQMDKTYISNIEPEHMESLSPASEFHKTELSTAIKMAMEEKLNADEQKYIKLRYFMGYSFKETAKMMNLSSNDFNALRKAAEGKLAEGLSDHE